MKFCGEEGEMEINKEELMHQRKEEILNSGKFARCEVVVGCDEDIPYVNLHIKNASIVEVMRLLAGIKSIKDGIFKQFPILKPFDEGLEVKTKVYDALKDKMIDEEGVCEDEETV